LRRYGKKLSHDAKPVAWAAHRWRCRFTASRASRHDSAVVWLFPLNGIMRASSCKRFFMVLAIQLILLAGFLFLAARPALPMTWYVLSAVVMLFAVPVAGYFYTLQRSSFAARMPGLLRTLSLSILSLILTLFFQMAGCILFFFMRLPMDIQMQGI
jgi:hypothetical protein